MYKGRTQDADFNKGAIGRMFIICSSIFFGFLLLFFIGVWHRDSHYWSQLIGGVHKLMIFVKEKCGSHFVNNPPISPY